MGGHTGHADATEETRSSRSRVRAKVDACEEGRGKAKGDGTRTRGETPGVYQSSLSHPGVIHNMGQRLAATVSCDMEDIEDSFLPDDPDVTDDQDNISPAVRALMAK